MKVHEELLLNNKAWAKSKVRKDPDYFKRLVNLQTPEYLWIGCSDSRVPPNEITGTHPGEIFIHRNIANVVVHTDMNCLSVLQYAVEVLKVKHVVVCGHYNCGGVKTAMSDLNLGLIDNWLRHIKDVYRLHQSEIDTLPESERADELVRWNVREQVLNLAKTATIQKAWKEQKGPMLHGWVYDLSDGIIDVLVDIDHKTSLEHPYTYNVGGSEDMAH